MFVTDVIDRALPGPDSALDRVSAAVQSAVAGVAQAPAVARLTRVLHGNEVIGHPTHLSGWLGGDTAFRHGVGVRPQALRDPHEPAATTDPACDRDGRRAALLSRVADAAVGALAGTAAAWCMDRVGWWMYRREDRAALERELRARPQGLDSAHLSARNLGGLVGRDPGRRQPNPTGLAVHYALGALPGALYALGRERSPLLQRGAGLPYGLALFVLNDELAAPLLGVARGPQHYPWQSHARGLVAHLVLGVATDRFVVAARRLDRRQAV